MNPVKNHRKNDGFKSSPLSVSYSEVSSRVNRIWSRYLLPKIPDIIALLILISIGLLPYRSLFSAQPFLYGDHPIHYFSLHYSLTRSLPIHHRLIDWNPYWYGGSPHLQFYPPGITFLGIVLYYLCLGLCSIGRIYNLTILLTLFLPVLCSYYFIRKIGWNVIAAFTSALLMLILTYIGSTTGFYYGIIIGLLNSRLAIGFFPLAVWLGIECILTPDKFRYFLGLALVLSFIILLHPDLIYLPLVGLGTIMFFFHREKICSLPRSLKSVAVPILLAFGFTAFWWLPLVIQHGYVSSMQVWSGKFKLQSSLSALWSLLSAVAERDTDKFILFLYFCAMLSFIKPQAVPFKKAVLKSLLLLPLLIFCLILFVFFVVIRILHIPFFDPVRLIDGISISMILVAGYGLSQLLEYAYTFLRKWRTSVQAILPAIGAVCILVLTFYFLIFRIQMFSRYPGNFLRVGHLDYMNRSEQLDELWNYLSTESHGRIIFTATGIPVKGLPPFFKSSVLTLTPIYTGRQIFGGQNTPFYPLATYFFYGQKPSAVVRLEADKLDNRSLLGMPWQQMDETRLERFCKDMNVTTMVTHQSETNVVDFFSRSRVFPLKKQIGDFFIYSISSYVPDWIQYDTFSADIRVVSFQENRIALAVSSATSDIPILVKVAYYPCWKAYLGKQQIPISTDEIGLMHLVLPKGKQYIVELTYITSRVEKLGWFITCISLISLFPAIFVTKRRKLSP